MAQVDLVAWTDVLAQRPDLRNEPLLEGWAQRRWPLVVRRRVQGDNPDLVHLGLSLPPEHGKRRIAIEVERDAILALHHPPSLLDVATTLSSAWRTTTDALLALDGELGITTRVFGSWAWQLLTGLTYGGPNSDLDLLWPATPQLARLLSRLRAIEADAPGSIDGEIAGGGWANWRELADGADDVLVKDLHGVRLVTRAQFFASATRAVEPA